MEHCILASSLYFSCKVTWYYIFTFLPQLNDVWKWVQFGVVGINLCTLRLFFSVDNLLTSISNIKEIKEIFILTQIFCSFYLMTLTLWQWFKPRQRKSFKLGNYKTKPLWKGKRCTRGTCHKLTLNNARTWRIMLF